METKKVVVKLGVHNDRDKKKAMKAVTALRGIDSISMNMKEQQMTVIGDMDPLAVVEKLRKFLRAEMVSVGPPKEPEKKGEARKSAEEKVNVCELYPKPEWTYYLPPPRILVECEEYPSRCVIC